MKPYHLFGVQWIGSMDNWYVHHVHHVQHIHVLYVLCHLFGAWRLLPLSVGRDDATRFLQLAKPSFPSVSTRTFFQIQFTTWPERATSYRAIFSSVVLSNCKMYEKPALESVIGRRRVLYNKRYQGDLLRLEKSDMKNLMAPVFASTILFSDFGPRLSIDWIFCFNVNRFSMCIVIIICLPKLFSWPFFLL